MWASVCPLGSGSKTSDLKQRCVLASMLWSTMSAWQLWRDTRYSLNGGLFNFTRHRSCTKGTITQLHEFQYADGIMTTDQTAINTKRSTNLDNEAKKSFGMQWQKDERPHRVGPRTSNSINFDEPPVESVDKFRYFRSIPQIISPTKSSSSLMNTWS